MHRLQVGENGPRQRDEPLEIRPDAVLRSNDGDNGDMLRVGSQLPLRYGLVAAWRRVGLMHRLVWARTATLYQLRRLSPTQHILNRYAQCRIADARKALNLLLSSPVAEVIIYITPVVDRDGKVKLLTRVTSFLIVAFIT